jgi:hypothetical protein
LFAGSIRAEIFKQKYHMYIGGEWVAPSSGEWFERYKPFTGEP